MDNLAEQINAEFICSLKRLRIEQGLTHQGLAEKAGLDRSYVGLLEKGERRPTLEVAIRMAWALGYPLSRLLLDVESRIEAEPLNPQPDEKRLLKIKVGQQIKRVRRKAGMSQEELAKRSSVNPVILSQIERDKMSPTMDDLYAICQGLGVTLPDLLASVR